MFQKEHYTAKATEATANASCNQHEAEKVEQKILEKMEEQNAFEFVFRRKDQIEKIRVKELVMDAKKVTEDQQLLFQRLLILSNNIDHSIDDLLKYELSSIPFALFDKYGLIREANKPQLAEALPITPQNDTQPTNSIVEYVMCLMRGTRCSDILGKGVKLLTR